MKRNWKASGTRHATLPPRKLEVVSENSSIWQVIGTTHEKPYVTQFDIENPAMFIIISMTMSLPLQLALDVSPCHTGAVDVLIPLPIPAMILPTIISGTPKDAICKIAPMLMIVVPKRMQFFLPSGSPITQTRMAPRKQPMS